MISSQLSTITRHISRAYLLAVFLAGCSTLPAFGPSGESIAKAATDTPPVNGATIPYQLVNLSATTLPEADTQVRLFPEKLRNQRLETQNQGIQVSDALEIHIWEVADDGLFATSGQRNTVLDVVVENDGLIELPYGGVIKASGLTTSELRAELLERYRGQAIEPEISVRIAQTRMHAVAILGDVRSPQRIGIPSSGIRILDVLASAGGIDYPLWEAHVSLQRNSRQHSLSLQHISNVPENNIIVLPGDTVQLTRKPRRFTVYGAVTRTANLTLPDQTPNLSALLAEAGGLSDMQAEPASVFIFRESEFKQEDGTTPLVYRLDFSRPDAFLLAGQIYVNENDIVYVATANASEFQKFVTTILSPFFGVTSGIQRSSG